MLLTELVNSLELDQLLLLVEESETFDRDGFLTSGAYARECLKKVSSAKNDGTWLFLLFGAVYRRLAKMYIDNLPVVKTDEVDFGDKARIAALQDGLTKIASFGKANPGCGHTAGKMAQEILDKWGKLQSENESQEEIDGMSATDLVGFYRFLATSEHTSRAEDDKAEALEAEVLRRLKRLEQMEHKEEGKDGG